MLVSMILRAHTAVFVYLFVCLFVCTVMEIKAIISAHPHVSLVKKAYEHLEALVRLSITLTTIPPSTLQISLQGLGHL